MRYFIIFLCLLLTCVGCSDSDDPVDCVNCPVDTDKDMTAMIDGMEFSGEWDDQDIPANPTGPPGISYQHPTENLGFELVFSYSKQLGEGTYQINFCHVYNDGTDYSQAPGDGTITFSKYGDDLVEGTFSVIMNKENDPVELTLTGSFSGDPFLSGKYDMEFELDALVHTCPDTRIGLPKRSLWFAAKDLDFNGGKTARIYLQVWSLNQDWLGEYDLTRTNSNAEVEIGRSEIKYYHASTGQITIASIDSIPFYDDDQLLGYEYIIGSGSCSFTAYTEEIPVEMVTITNGLLEYHAGD
jgi:hypothetical protein